MEADAYVKSLLQIIAILPFRLLPAHSISALSIAEKMRGVEGKEIASNSEMQVTGQRKTPLVTWCGSYKVHKIFSGY